MTPAGLARGLRLGLAYFLAVFAAGFALGTLRVLVVAPRLGETWAVLAELPLMLGLAWMVSRRLLRGGADSSERAIMGLGALVLLLAAELGLGRLLSGASPAETARHWLSPPGALGLAGQGVFALLPLVRSRGRR